MLLGSHHHQRMLALSLMATSLAATPSVLMERPRCHGKASAFNKSRSKPPYNKTRERERRLKQRAKLASNA